MDLEGVRQQVIAHVGKHDDEDVAVRVALGEDLHVAISSRDPLTYYTQFVHVRSDGTVERPTTDDGFTLDMEKTTVGKAATPAEAVDLVVREVEAAVDWLREKQARAAEWARPSQQPAVSAEDLAGACALWQGGQNVGSSPIRAAARVLTGVHHYFRAEFITGYETAARSQRETLDAGIALLRAVNAAPHLEADGWNTWTGLPPRAFAGRGIGAKPDEDPQIERHLRTRQIEMPLWGVSLSREVADGFGTRFLFELVGPFPAVPARALSGTKAEEQELVTGGRYKVLSQEQCGETTHVRLRWIGASGDRVGSDDVLLAALGAVPGVLHSSLTRSAGSELLELRLGDEDSATVTRSAGSDEVEVVRYWAPEPGWAAKGDDPYTQAAAIRAASRRTTVPADVDAIAAAALKGKGNE
ncbi:hypothetical protein [Geodermatophilus chilensis]|uniref:hypothetical protein n=1 Tax=Geodermatophilus chilensis TaxID=2035835 RepID=UPI000C26479F|nr:hypothetical protein [Geodermatophilus chilensis]